MYRVQSLRVARSALTFATMAAAFYAVAFLIFLILMFSWTVIGPMFHQPIHPPAAREAAMIPFLPLIIFVLALLFFLPIRRALLLPLQSGGKDHWWYRIQYLLKSEKDQARWL